MGYDDTLIDISDQTIPVTFTGTLINDVVMIDIDEVDSQ